MTSVPSLPRSLYTADSVKTLDQLATDQGGIPSAELMERAGSGAFDVLRDQYPTSRRIVVVCGAGNNAGDGYVVARLACDENFAVSIVQVGAIERLTGDAKTNFERLPASVRVTASPEDIDIADVDVVVDALLGTGLLRDVEGPWAHAVAWMNASAAPVLALDVPSGLDSDTGRICGCAVHADITTCFVGLKRGLFTGRGPSLVGALHYFDLDIGADVFSRVTQDARRVSYADVTALLAPRPRHFHKGDCGHVLIVGGDRGFAGAARMAAEAAARAGAGLISVATHPEHARMLGFGRPEIMVHGVSEMAQLQALMARSDLIAIGPGLGQSSWSQHMWSLVASSEQPCIVDADALNLLAREPRSREDWVLTPHPGEAARLLGGSTVDVQDDRFATVRKLVGRYGGIVVLKGSGSLIADADSTPLICGHGNPGMASGGMGDVLTGVIAGLVGQGLTLPSAAAAGVCVHALAADREADQGERGMLASDLMPWIRRLVNP